MSSHELYSSLLRPTVIQILRAAGFQATRPAVLDTVVDVAVRYLLLLGQKTASYSLASHDDLIPTVSDVRAALQDVGAFRPQISAMEEQYRGTEDMRGVEAFLAWAMGDVNKEIRRIAGLVPSEGEVVALEPGEERQDFLSVLKKKHSKTGEESRYQGTVLGKAAEAKDVRIEGGPAETIQAWHQKLRQKASVARSSRTITPVMDDVVSDESSPLTDIG